MLDDLLRYRTGFPIIEIRANLISDSVGAMQHAVYNVISAMAANFG
jgi:hypothetical protein